MAKVKMDKHYERLARLYLRLKGYLVSNLIIHSDVQGNAKSELDIVAVRMPYHLQEYRYVQVEDYLESSHSRIEILIGDVKNYTAVDRLKFNKALRDDRESIRQLVDWLGIYERVEEQHVDKIQAFLNLHRNKDLTGFGVFDEETPVGKFRIRFTLFCPSLAKWNGKGFKYIHGDEMLGFVWECLNESRVIETCSRRYDFGGWNELEPYVRIFKGGTERVTKQVFENACDKIK